MYTFKYKFLYTYVINYISVTPHITVIGGSLHSQGKRRHSCESHENKES